MEKGHLLYLQFNIYIKHSSQHIIINDSILYCRKRVFSDVRSNNKYGDRVHRKGQRQKMYFLV
jgi:hypothetical protein